MARKIRIEYAGAAYHVMARGNQGRDISSGDRDRKLRRFNAEAQRFAEVRRELFFSAFLRGPLRRCVQIRLALVGALPRCASALSPMALARPFAVQASPDY